MRSVVLTSPVCLRGQAPTCSTSSSRAHEQQRAPGSLVRALARLPAESRGSLCFGGQGRQQLPAARDVASCAHGDVTTACSSTEVPCMLGLPEEIERFYLFGQTLGAGAYGTVRFGYNKHSDLEVAIKVLPKQRNGAPVTTRSLRKLQREVAIHSAIQDCGQVVNLYDAYEDADHVYLVLELCRGQTLEQHLLTHGAMSERQTALVVHEVLKVVATCHANGILHGDVKAANFVFAREAAGRSVEEVAASSSGPWLKAIDFGCSQRWRGSSFQMRVGTPVFMAPEVFVRDYGLPADLWSTGILAYELFAGRFPFWDTLDECKSRTLDEVMKAVIVDEIDFSYGPWTGVSAAGLDLMQRLLCRDPAQRISAADALRHPWFEEQGVTAPLPQHAGAASSNIVPYHAAGAPLDGVPAPAAKQQLVS